MTSPNMWFYTVKFPSVSGNSLFLCVGAGGGVCPSRDTIAGFYGTSGPQRAVEYLLGDLVRAGEI